MSSNTDNPRRFGSHLANITWKALRHFYSSQENLAVDDVSGMGLRAADLRDQGQRGQATMPAKPRILCVDDDRSARQALRRCLRKQFDVTTAESGGQALAAMEAGPAFAVLLQHQETRAPGEKTSRRLTITWCQMPSSAGPGVRPPARWLCPNETRKDEPPAPD